MKNLSKVVQLVLLCTVVFAEKQIIAGPPKPAPELKPVYKNQREIEQEKRAAAEQQRIQQEATRMSGITPSAPPTTRSSLYPSLSQNTASSIPRTKPVSKIALKRPSSSQAKTALTSEELQQMKTAAELTQTIWGRYVLTIQEENEGFYEDDWTQLKNDLTSLERIISTLKKPELIELYAPIKEVFSSDNIWNEEIVATHLYNLITAINQLANTSYDLTDIAQYIAIEAEENPLYSAYAGMTDWLYSWGNKPREAWTSAKQAAASTWDYAKQKVQYAKSFVGQPSKEEFNDATMRLSEIKRLEQLNRPLSTNEKEILATYKKYESQDRAMVAKWWPYLVTAATLGAFYYMFPEFSKNVAGYGAGAVGYVAKPLAAGAVGYGGYKLLTAEPTSTKKIRTIPKPTQMKKIQPN